MCRDSMHMYAPPGMPGCWQVIERHIMSNDDDPFNRQPLAVKVQQKRTQEKRLTLITA